VTDYGHCEVHVLAIVTTSCAKSFVGRLLNHTLLGMKRFEIGMAFVQWKPLACIVLTMCVNDPSLIELAIQTVNDGFSR